MVHLIDVRRALESRRYRAEGALSLGWTSEGGTEAVTLVVRGSRGELAPAALDLRIDLSVETLASVIAAGLMPSQAVELGLARASSREAVDLADTLFGGPRFQCLDTF
jgi:hypothetical protein